MKIIRHICILALFLSSASIVFGQESGNRAYGQQRREPTKNSGTLSPGGDKRGLLIEANVLMNVKADGYVVVFGVAQEAGDADASNAKVNELISSFVRSISGLGIQKSDTYVDFITQNKVYDYTSSEPNTVLEVLKGFETKKTIAVRYKERGQLDAIINAAAKASIFDLIKVDYVINDLPAAHKKLYDEATKIVREKEDRYRNSFNLKIAPVAILNEKYDSFYPGELYNSYRAFEAGNTYNSYNSNYRVIQQRKGSTLYYEPLDVADFDQVINPMGIEPMVQLTLYMRIEYSLS